MSGLSVNTGCMTLTTERLLVCTAIKSDNHGVWSQFGHINFIQEN